MFPNTPPRLGKKTHTGKPVSCFCPGHTWTSAEAPAASLHPTASPMTRFQERPSHAGGGHAAHAPLCYPPTPPRTRAKPRAPTNSGRHGLGDGLPVAPARPESHPRGSPAVGGAPFPGSGPPIPSLPLRTRTFGLLQAMAPRTWRRKSDRRALTSSPPGEPQLWFCGSDSRPRADGSEQHGGRTAQTSQPTG